MAGELEPFDIEAELAWLVSPVSPAPSPAELARQSIRRGLPMVIDGLVRLALSAESERTRFDASRYVVSLASLLGVAEVTAPNLDELVRQVIEPGPGAGPGTAAA